MIKWIFKYKKISRNNFNKNQKKNSIEEDRKLNKRKNLSPRKTINFKLIKAVKYDPKQDEHIWKLLKDEKSFVFLSSHSNKDIFGWKEAKIWVMEEVCETH